MGHEKGQFLNDWITRKEAEQTFVADVVHKTSSMESSVMHDLLSATNISTYENLCKTVNIL